MIRIRKALLLLACLAGARAPMAQPWLLAFDPAGHPSNPVVVGDLNGDGWPDLAMGDGDFSTCGGDDDPSGRLVVSSGFDGTLLFEVPSAVCSGMFAELVEAVGDWDGDGTPDLFAGGGAGFGGMCRAFVLSGVDGSRLACLGVPAWTTVNAATRVPDLTGDGRDELLLGSANGPAGSVGGTVRLFAGGSGALLWEAEGCNAGDAFGISVDNLGDVDGDGLSDVIVGAPGVTSASFGSVSVLSGRTGQVLHEIPAPTPVLTTPPQGFGHQVAGAGDVDGDGTPDLLVSLKQETALDGLGLVRVYSGATGAYLLGLHGSPGDGFGAAIASAGDLDFDGHADLAVGEPKWSGLQDEPGSLHLFSGADGSLLFTLEGSQPGDWFGRMLTPAGDFDGDGLHDLLVGSSWLLGVLSGHVLGPDLVELPVLAGSAGDAGFGSAVDGGDFDGDGSHDVLVGVPGSSLGGTGAGAVRGLSGHSGVVLFERLGDAPGDALGSAVVTVGDVDGDGRQDLLAGAPFHAGEGVGADAGTALLLSGADGSLIRRFDGEAAGDRLGSALAGPGDLDGDGIPDLALGAPGHGSPAGAGVVWVRSGADGALWFRVDGSVSGEGLGSALAAAGDLDLDGVPDLLIGAPWALVDGGVRGRVTGHSGLDGTLLLTLDGVFVNSQHGMAVAGGHDLDGDGVPDVVVGAPKEKASLFDLVGAVRVLSGADGSVLWKKKAAGAIAGLGRAVASPGDLDADGFADVVMGSGLGAGLARVHRGFDGKHLLALVGETGSGFGEALAAADLDGDGTAELLVGAPNAGALPDPAGVVRTYALASQWTLLGGGVAGALGLPVLTGSGAMVPGASVGLSLYGAPVLAPGRLVFGFTMASIPFHGGALVPSPDVLSPLVTSAAGAAHWSAPWDPGLPPGSVFFVQAWIVDAGVPGGFAASHALLAQVP